MDRQLESKKFSYFWHLLCLRRLEGFIEQHKRELEEKGIKDLVDLLSHLIPIHLVPLAATGRYELGLAAREALIDMFDPYKIQRHDVERRLSDKKSLVAKLKKRPFREANYESFVERGEEIARAREEAQDLAVELSKVPESNTIPEEIWKYPDQLTLKKEGFIEDVVDVNKYAQLTDRGYQMHQLSSQLMRTLPIDLSEPEISKEHARAIWEQVKMAMVRKGKFKALIGKLYGNS